MKQTTKSLLTVLGLVVVAGAIGGAALWAGRDAEKQAGQKETTGKIFDFENTQVRSLRVENPAGTLVAALERKDERAGWDITEPVKAEADDVTANAVVNALALLKQKKDLGQEKDGKPYGLDAPVAAVSVKTVDGKEARLEIGADNPFDKTAFVRKGGDPTIRTVEASAKESFLRDLFQLRDKSIAHLETTADVRRIEVSGTRVSYTLEKDGAAWKLASPAGVADSALADGIAGSLKSLRATDIAAETAPVPAVYGLAPAKVTVKLSAAQADSKEALTRTLHFGVGRDGSTYAMRDGTPAVFQVDGQILKDLDKDLFDLQDKQLTHVARDDVRKIVLESPGAGKVEIAREKSVPADGGTADESFSLLSPQRGPAKKFRVSGALYTIAGLRAAVWGPKNLPRQGFDKPRSVTLLGEGDKVLFRMLAGAETPEHRRYVLVDGMDRVAQVEKGAVDGLPWKVEDVLDDPAPPVASLPDGGVAAAH